MLVLPYPDCLLTLPDDSDFSPLGTHSSGQDGGMAEF